MFAEVSALSHVHLLVDSDFMTRNTNSNSFCTLQVVEKFQIFERSGSVLYMLHMSRVIAGS